ncbi:hypothetical protein GCK72_014057 [Caenorhabditis remanei]|uniref:SXP/RAL-2 family protein Ani s 5-like cation-binding domain-containing protein n=1 Tax=Caenorhabditis remanei TaxID=31234 RepID=A0A6A5GSF6_CAERE|nr:hypothetical protein GCK72_014057 [Caenorhabditis remanei]KAF1757601.1 hypothetical protein GCK72_014057 [Caenorhabditis remanei]
MARNLIFITIALIAVVVAGPGERGQKGPGGDHKRGGPGGHHFLLPFFGNVSDEGKKEIGAVFKNEALTLAQVDTQIAALAEKYGVAAAYKDHKEKEAARHAEIKKNTTAVISSLSSVASKLSAIFENKDQTRKAHHEAIEALRKENRVAVDTVEFIGKRLGGFGGGRHGGHGGRRGGHDGGNKKDFGGKHGDKKGPHGGDEKKKTKEAVAAPAAAH